MGLLSSIFPSYNLRQQRQWERLEQEVLLESQERKIRKLEHLHALRSYHAASQDRLVADWRNASSSIDADIRQGLVPVRLHARDLRQNNGWVKKYLSAVRKNVVGADGFAHHADVREFVDGKYTRDRIANAKIEEAVRRWMRPENCSLDGRLSFRAICLMLMDYAAGDGEFCVRKVVNKASAFGFSLEIIPTEAVDETANGRTKDGNIVKMGVELDAKRRPVAYYIRKANLTQELYGSFSYTGEVERVPAAKIIHGFDREYINQTRGISWIVQAMRRMKLLDGFDEASVIAARIAAAAGGFFYDEKGEAAEPVYDGVDENGNKKMNMESGIFRDIGGKRFMAFDPKHPVPGYENFLRGQLHGVAAGLDIAYTSLSGDLSNANYGSNRVGMLDERESWKLIQQWFIENFIDRIYPDIIEAAILSGNLNLPMSKLEKFSQAVWTGRRWGWIDPLKDAMATIIKLKAGLTTHYIELAQNGEDAEQIIEDIAEFQALLKKKDVVLDLDGVKIPIELLAETQNTDGSQNDGNDPVREAEAILKKRNNGHHKETLTEA